MQYSTKFYHNKSAFTIIKAYKYKYFFFFFLNCKKKSKYVKKITRNIAFLGILFVEFKLYGCYNIKVIGGEVLDINMF